MAIKWDSVIVPRVKQILEYRRQQGVPTATLRGIFYILVSEGLIENLPQPYKGLSEALVKARKNGLIPYDWITDENRAIINIRDAYYNPERYIKDTLESLMELPDNYSSDLMPRWYKQPEYVEVWVEKNAMAGVMSAVIGESRQVRIVPNGGWSSETFHHDNLERLKTKKFDFDSEEHIKEREKYPNDFSKWRHVGGRKVTVLYYGDYDPTGYKMVQNIQRDIEAIGANFERVAITKEQIAEYNLEYLKEEMTQDVKDKLGRDPNALAFAVKNEGELFQIELDALNALAPDDFITLLENSVDNHFNETIYNELLRDKKYSRVSINRQVRKSIKNFDKLAKEFNKKQNEEQER